MQTLEEYYNKFNEDKRLLSRRGNIEYITNMKYIHKYLTKDSKIIDIGAGTGRYSIPLHREGFDVTAIELIKHNLSTLIKKDSTIKAYQANALDLSKYPSNNYDIILLFGPLYHLLTKEDQIKALNEARRITKKDGYIFVSYCMNEYALLKHGFIDRNIIKNLNNKEIDNNFHITKKGNELYKYMRLEEIDELNKKCHLKRVEIISSDGATSYIKDTLNKMTAEEYQVFIDYHLSTCERKELLGASTHVLDILKCQ